MSLFGRLKDLVKTNVHELADTSDNPERSLNQYIEEATEHVREFRVEVSRLEAHTIELQKSIQECKQAIEDWHKQAKQAMAQNQEEAARAALEHEQREREDMGKYQTELTASEENLKQLHEQYERLQTRLEQAKEKRDNLVQRNRLATAQASAFDSMANLSPDDPVSPFEQFEEKVERHEAEAKAATSTQNLSFSEEISELQKTASDSKVDKALAELKDELDKDTK